MARGRMISKSLSTSRKFAALHEEAGELAEFCQVLFPLLVAHADDFGRLPGDVFTIRHLVLPTSPRSLEQFNIAICVLDRVGLIQRYHVADHSNGGDGGDFIQILCFEQHQVGLSKRTKSKFPRPPGNSRKFTGVQVQLNRTKQNLTKQNLTELNGTELNGNTNTGATKTAPEPVDMLFEQFASAYPAHRQRRDVMTQQAFIAACESPGFSVLLAALEQHKRSEEWQTARLVPSMGKWLSDKQWNNVLPEPHPNGTNGHGASKAAVDRRPRPPSVDDIRRANERPPA